MWPQEPVELNKFNRSTRHKLTFMLKLERNIKLLFTYVYLIKQYVAYNTENTEG